LWNSLQQKATTGFRRKLFAQNGGDSGGLSTFAGLSSKIPRIPRVFNQADLAAANMFDKANTMAQREK
jgi:hypothetical protein